MNKKTILSIALSSFSLALVSCGGNGFRKCLSVSVGQTSYSTATKLTRKEIAAYKISNTSSKISNYDIEMYDSYYFFYFEHEYDITTKKEETKPLPTYFDLKMYEGSDLIDTIKFNKEQDCGKFQDYTVAYYNEGARIAKQDAVFFEQYEKPIGDQSKTKLERFHDIYKAADWQGKKEEEIFIKFSRPNKNEKYKISKSDHQSVMFDSKTVVTYTDGKNADTITYSWWVD